MVLLLLLRQVECADVLLLNKADTVGQQELTMLQVRHGGSECSSTTSSSSSSRYQSRKCDHAAGATMGSRSEGCRCSSALSSSR
jgi:G3E family GTPase